jgi:molecular chaperone GrpE
VTHPVEPPPAETGPSDPPDPIVELRRERDDYQDRWMRKAAEFDNYRRRIERERREQTDEAVVRLLQELLLIVDDFDRALTAEAGESESAYRKGVEPIEALGADFDPNLHQAVVQEDSADHRDGEVIGEMRKGYMINDRLLRPAMVKVAKAS